MRSWLVCFWIAVSLASNCWNLSFSMYPIWWAMVSCVSSSKAEPKEMSRNLAKSDEVRLEDPSAILDAMETAARCNWLHKPNFSLSGNFSVSW